MSPRAHGCTHLVPGCCSGLRACSHGVACTHGACCHDCWSERCPEDGAPTALARAARAELVGRELFDAQEPSGCDRCHGESLLHVLAGVRLRATTPHRTMRVCYECMIALAEIGARRERGFGDEQLPQGAK